MGRLSNDYSPPGGSGGSSVALTEDWLEVVFTWPDASASGFAGDPGAPENLTVQGSPAGSSGSTITLDDTSKQVLIPDAGLYSVGLIGLGGTSLTGTDPVQAYVYNASGSLRPDFASPKVIVHAGDVGRTAVFSPVWLPTGGALVFGVDPLGTSEGTVDFAVVVVKLAPG